MKQLLIGYALLGLSCAAPLRADAAGAISYAGGDGSSMEKAIIEQGVTTDGAATKAEYVYLAQHFPHYHMGRQSLLNEKGKAYDLLEFTDASGHQGKVYFDITATFGKF
jgi:hypothetical protein